MPSYGRSSNKLPTLAKVAQYKQLNQLGLDMVSPIDIMKDGRTPYGKNFRLYAQQSDDRQVAVSNRKGSGFYINPLSETKTLSEESITGASTVVVNKTTSVVLQKFVAPNSNRLTKLEINISNPNGATGAVLLQVWSDNSGIPGTLLAESSLTSIDDTASYIGASFIAAPKLTSAATYWIVLAEQDDCTGEYVLSTTTNSTDAKITNSALTSAVAQTYSINYKLYTSPDTPIIDGYRFYRDNGVNVTVVVIGTTMYSVNETTHALTSIATGLSASATKYSFDYGDNKLFWVNGYDGLKYWDGSTVTTITDAELPILSQITFHKDRLWGVSASDPNKLHFSEVPGNPKYKADNITPEVPTLQWYNAWRSVDFIYVPRPHNGSPVTAMKSFQDSLFVFTQDGKYVISGYDSGSFTQRESTGFQGALSYRGVAKDENNIYFVGKDGLYSFDGTYDKKISTPIDPLFNGSSNKYLISPVIWKNKVRFYMPSSASSVCDTCVLYNKDLDEWEYDTNTFVKMAIEYDDADDKDQLVEISSVAPVMYLAEKGYNNLGAPIDFEYRFNYNSLGSPAQKKRIKKFFPILQGVDSTFPVTIAIDRDFQNSPRYKTMMLTVNGTVFGTAHELGDGTLFGGQTSFKMNRMRLSGYGNYWQMRVIRKAVNNRVAFVGAQFSYKTKRI